MISKVFGIQKHKLLTASQASYFDTSQEVSWTSKELKKKEKEAIKGDRECGKKLLIYLHKTIRQEAKNVSVLSGKKPQQVFPLSPAGFGSGL